MSFNIPEENLTKDPIRVMIVDDSAIVRGLVSKMLTSDPGITVTMTVGSAQGALIALDNNDIEVIILDIEMPEMNGVQALPLLLGKKPDIKIIMASTLTLKNAEISLKALSLGASDYIPKPSSTGLVGNSDFRTQLIEKVKDWGTAKRKGFSYSYCRKREEAVKEEAPKKKSLLSIAPEDIKFSPTNNNLIAKAIGIGSSTGGPQALFKLFSDLRGNDITQPIFITQHMPATFTKILADHITKAYGKTAVEASDGMTVEQNVVYVAPGGFHMIMENDIAVNDRQIIRITSTPPENFCRPSVDPMFRSMVKVYGGNILAVILTGMGNDGCKGAAEIVKAGGNLIAQDEESSVVWGMPGAVALAGLCSSILPLNNIAPYVIKVAARR